MEAVASSEVFLFEDLAQNRLIFAKEEREENQPTPAFDFERLMQQRRGKDDGRAARRHIALIAKLRKPKFTSSELLSVQIEGHGEAAISGGGVNVAMTVQLPSSVSLITPDAKSFITRYLIVERFGDFRKQAGGEAPIEEGGGALVKDDVVDAILA
jgi:hypothetical protein